MPNDVRVNRSKLSVVSVVDIVVAAIFSTGPQLKQPAGKKKILFLEILSISRIFLWLCLRYKAPDFRPQNILTHRSESHSVREKPGLPRLQSSKK